MLGARGARAVAEQAERAGAAGEPRPEHVQVGLAHAHRALEGGAVVAGAQVGADAAGAQVAAVAVRQAAAHARALGRAAVDGVVQGGAGVEDGAAGGLVGDAEGEADLVVAQAAELAHDQGAALALGQHPQVVDELGEAGALLGVDLGAGDGQQVVGVDAAGDGLAAAHDVDRLVVGDPVQPRLQRAAGLAAGQRAQRVLERALRGVVGVLGVEQDRAAVAEQRLVVALEERGEGGLVAGGGAAGEGFVAHAREGDDARSAGRKDGGGLHRVPVSADGDEGLSPRTLWGACPSRDPSGRTSLRSLTQWVRSLTHCRGSAGCRCCSARWRS